MSSTPNHVVQQFIQVLNHLEIDTVFGLVGIPIVTLANEMIKQGIKFIPFRNEQSASYAASAYGYLTGKPAVLLVVGGPGLIHSLAGIYNSISNRWPLMVIAGSNDNGQEQYKGAFQELDQISLLSGHVKFSGKLNSDNIEQILYQSYNIAIQGTYGVTYVDFPGNLIQLSNDTVETVPKLELPPVPRKIKYCPDPNTLNRVSEMIQENKNKEILVVIGKGCQESSTEINEFINTFQLPFLPTPMAKGIIRDTHPLNVSSARSLVLKNASLVVVFGARLNWILHYAESTKWNSDAVFIQCDNNPETLGHNNTKGVNYSLCGDIGLSILGLTQILQKKQFKYHKLSNKIIEKIVLNEEKLKDLEIKQCNEAKLNYHSVYKTLRECMDLDNTFLITEGANTMDKARISFPCLHPKSRLDAGTNATMGVGLGYSIAARLYPENEDKDIVLIQGDSAFGFSGMEIETLTRLKLGVVIVIMNNSGIYHGNDPGSSTKLTEKCRYDYVAQGLGSSGHLITTRKQLKDKFNSALQAARSNGATTLLNVIIDHGGSNSVSFAWQGKSKL